MVIDSIYDTIGMNCLQTVTKSQQVQLEMSLFASFGCGISPFLLPIDGTADKAAMECPEPPLLAQRLRLCRNTIVITQLRRAPTAVRIPITLVQRAVA